MNPDVRRVLVTGASGFIGGHVCAGLLRRGCRVAALVRPESGHPPVGVQTCPVAGLHDVPPLRRALDGADALIHVAARVHAMGDEARDSLDSYRRANVDTTAALLEAAESAGVRRFVFASSVKAVGGGRPAAYTEADAPAPEDPYGRSKLEAERLVGSADGAGRLRTVILRFPLVYGPAMKGNMLRLFDWIERGRPVPATQDNRRSLLYVGNAAEAVRVALVSDGAAGGTFFVRDGEDVSSAELVEAIARALGRQPRILPVPRPLLRLAGRIGDVFGRVAPTSLSSAALERLFGSLAVDDGPIRERAGFRPQYTMDEGLAITAEWYRFPGRLHEAGSAATL